MVECFAWKVSIMNTLNLLIILALVINAILVAHGDMFTAQVELESLIDTKQLVIESFKIYLSNEKMRLHELQRKLERFMVLGKQTLSDVVMSNPIDSFLILKELSTDLDNLLVLVDSHNNSNDLKTTINDLKQTHKFPSDQDITGAAIGLARLQDTYLLDTEAMARGELAGHCCASKLTANDCFEVGRQLHNSGDYEHSVLWMAVALRQVKEGEAQNNSEAVPEVDILEYLAVSTYRIGEISNAITLNYRLLELAPSHPTASDNIVKYSRLLNDTRNGLVENGNESNETFTNPEKRVPDYEISRYEALCRGEGPAYQIGTSCQYVTNDHPFFAIGPLKQEITHTNPNIYIYYEVLLESEIQVIKDLAQPKICTTNFICYDLSLKEQQLPTLFLEKGLSQNIESPNLLSSKGDHEFVARVNRKISLITGLNLQTAEDLQVGNYGIGGHYVPHYDFIQGEESSAAYSLGSRGNRIATMLFYMSDVEAGGATVFPRINVTLWPKKGSAAFWFNIFEDGQVDHLTLHAACPVLVGSKWVANKWIRERGQELIRPCNITPSMMESSGNGLASQP